MLKERIDHQLDVRELFSFTTHFDLHDLAEDLLELGAKVIDTLLLAGRITALTRLPLTGLGRLAVTHLIGGRSLVAVS